MTPRAARAPSREENIGGLRGIRGNSLVNLFEFAYISRGEPRTLVLFACPRKKREKVRRNRLIIKNTYGGIDETFRWLLYLGLASEKLDGERWPLFRVPLTSFVLRARSTTWRCGS